MNVLVKVNHKTTTVTEAHSSARPHIGQCLSILEITGAPGFPEAIKAVRDTSFLFWQMQTATSPFESLGLGNIISN